MESDNAYVFLIVGFLIYRACDLQAVRAKIDLSLRRIDITQPPFAEMEGMPLRLFNACSWLHRQIPTIFSIGLLMTMLIFGYGAIAGSQQHATAHQQALALVAAIAAVAVSGMGMMIETLRNELDRIRG